MDVVTGGGAQSHCDWPIKVMSVMSNANQWLLHLSVKVPSHPGQVIKEFSSKLMKLRNETSFKLQEGVQLLTTKLCGIVTALCKSVNCAVLHYGNEYGSLISKR